VAESKINIDHLIRTNVSSLEVRCKNSVGTIIIHAETPSATTPSIWVDINANTKNIVFYKNTGSSWASVGELHIP